MFQFTLTSPAVTMALLLTLVNIAIVTPEEREAVFKYLGPGNAYSSFGQSSHQKIYMTQSLTECALMTLQTNGIFFSYDNVSQFCDTYGAGMRVSSTQNRNKMCFYKTDTWIFTYRVKRPTSVNIYKSFLSIEHSTWKNDQGVYRAVAIQSWSHLPVKLVRLTGFYLGKPVLELLFDGRNSTIDNWFQYARLIRSPWTDLNATNFNMFSLRGNEVDRSFAIGYFGDTCEEDRGWMTVIERQFNCSYANLTYYPAILFADSNSQTNWSKGYGLVDYMFVEYHL